VDCGATGTGAPSSLRVVRASVPRRPAWKALYLPLALFVGGGGVGTWRAHTAGEQQLVAALMGLAVLATLAFWIRCNRMALSRLGEPAAGAGPLAVRIVRSRRRVDPAAAEGRIVRLAPGQPLPPCPTNLTKP
jgi:hypothetical protein